MFSSVVRKGIPWALLVCVIVPALADGATDAYERGIKAKQAKEYETAIREFRSAVEQKADYVDAHWALAWCYVAVDQTDPAITEFEAVVRLEPDGKRAHEAKEAIQRLRLKPAEGTPTKAKPAPPAPVPKLPPDASADQILNAFATVYAGIDHYMTSGVYTLEVAGTPRGNETKFDFAYERPNHWRLEVQDPTEGLLMVSDGKQQWESLNILHQYCVAPAAPGFDLANTQIGKLAGSDLMVCARLFSGEAPVAKLQRDDVRRKLVGTETLRFPDASSCRAYHLELTFQKDKAQSALELWIDTDSFLLRRARVTQTLAGQGRLSISGNDFRVVRTEYYTSVVAHTALPPQTFTFTAGPDFTKVAKFEMPELMGAVNWENKKLPDINGKTTDGQTVSSADWAGKVVLIDFWATWCPPCQRSMPELDHIYKDLGGKGLIVIGINDEFPGTASQFLKQNNITYPTLMDPDHSLFQRFGVQVIPTMLLVDKDGIVRKQLVGLRPEEELRDALKQLGIQ